MIIKAYAKINLAINIKGKREDNYHELDMIMLPLELHDSIDIMTLPEKYETYVTCDDYSLETGEYNLCTITVRKMKEIFNIKKNFRIHIHKNIPMGAGLGGGSADAAAVIRGIKTLLKLDIPYNKEIELAQSIGADVPFCLRNMPARVEGVGEKLTPIIALNNYYVLIVKPHIGLNTKEVYNQYDIVGSNSKADISKLIELLSIGEDNLAPYMGNELEKAAITLLPEIEKLKNLLMDDGFKNVMMSGSGSSVFIVSTNHKALEKEFKKLEKLGYQTHLTKILK